MISIIVSSYQEHYYNQLVKNINETIGINTYEIIQIWNPNLMGITQAYNKGAQKAQYENLLFIHEDVFFHTQNWGEKLIFHLDKENTGIIGVAGSSYVPYAPSSWTVAEKYNLVNILQGNKENQGAFAIHTTKESRNKVFAVDGVFLGIKKKIYAQYKFNENLLKGFHGYDLDFSLTISRYFQNYVIDDILIEHFSKGNLDKNWLDANIKVKQNQNKNFNINIDPETEKKIFMSFLYKYFEYYPVTKKNILFTLRFFPFKYLSFKDNVSVIRKYFNYIRYASEINKKLTVNA